MVKSFFSKNIIIILLFSLMINLVCFANTRNLIVTGDSYAQHFYKDEKNNGVRIDVFAQEGKTIEENMQIILDSFNREGRYVLFAISVNDAIRKTPIDRFKNELRKIFERAMNMHKVVFVHSYIEYNFDGDVPNLVFPNVYDVALREVAQEYTNVFYLDMSSLLSSDFFGVDTIHASSKFNDAVFSYIYVGLMPYLELQKMP